jgi:hypothetical protein
MVIKTRWKAVIGDTLEGGNIQALKTLLLVHLYYFGMILGIILKQPMSALPGRIMRIIFTISAKNGNHSHNMGQQ